MKAPEFLKSKRNRLIFFGFIVVLYAIAMFFLEKNKPYDGTFLNNFFQPQTSNFLIIVIPVLIGIVGSGIFLRIVASDFHEWLKGDNKSETPPQGLTENIEPDIKLLFGSLKERYKKRYESKLDGRFEITLEVNKDWNFNQPQTFKVNYCENTNIDEAFRTINEAFERQGRLLIVGSPGSGKTVLLLKLAIELLGDECKADQKLPVIFNLASWSPDYKTFDDWLIDVLNAGNGLSKDFARMLLEQNRIIFLLDGLDELARNETVEIAIEKRAKCLDSLNDYLRMGRKAVICCRREEFAEMQKATNQDAPVSAKVEVLDLGKPEIILALQHAQQDTKSNASATNLLKIIETNDVFLDVLATPFYFTTALEVFDSEILKEKDFPTDKAEIKKYLLDKFIDSKLRHASKLSEFEKDKAKILKWLSWLAKLMEKKQLVNFELADLQPDNLKRAFVYKINLSIVTASLFTFATFSPLYIYNNDKIVFLELLGLIFLPSLLTGCFVGFRSKVIQTEELNSYSLKPLLKVSIWKNILFTGMSWWILFIAVFFILSLYVKYTTPRLGEGSSLFIDIVDSILFGFFVSLLIFIERILDSCRIIKKLVILNNNYQQFYSGIMRNLIKWNVASFLTYVVVLEVLLGPGVHTQNVISPLLFLYVSTIGCLLDMPMFKHFVLCLCLYLEGSTPLKYATFLDLAAEARILEKDGGHWRFRHQTLQEHFAKQYDTL